MKNNEEDLDFTSQEDAEIVISHPSKATELARRFSTTKGSILSRRMYLMKERKARASRRPAARREKSIETTSTTHFILKFGGSSMVLKKDEVSLIEISDSGIIVVN